MPLVVRSFFWMKTGAAAAVASAAVSLAPASLSAQPAQQPPMVVEVICLEGGRSARLCACAEQRMFEQLGREQYGQYEAVSQAYLTRPEAGWPAAAAKVAALPRVRADAAKVLEQTKAHGRAHRKAMKDCAAVTGAKPQ